MTLLLCLSFCYSAMAQGLWEGNTTPTYAELVAICEEYDEQHQEIELYNMGTSDAGLPIYVLIVNGAQDSISTFQKARKSTTILVNNAIHPGEPDGVNAMILWIDEWITQGKTNADYPVIAFIPAYNVGGMLNRSSSSRANQLGPEEYGFRGNAKNFDLNRDFIKMDTKNSFTFAKIFHGLDPDVFIDNHVSNGADYQHTITLISNLTERMSPEMGEYRNEKMLPTLTDKLKEDGWDMVPYMNTIGAIPDSGIASFNDLGRYAMGYAALFNCFSFTVETHMLKPFDKRVQATKDFFEQMLTFCIENSQEIELLRDKSRALPIEFAFGYALDKSKCDSVLFKGYEAKYKPSEVTGLSRLYYDRNEPFTRNIAHYNQYLAESNVQVPKSFVVPAREVEVIERLLVNEVKMEKLDKDTVLPVTAQRVVHYKNSGRPYEGHFLYSEVKVEYEQGTKQFQKGDWVIQVTGDKCLFLMSVLIAEAEDSYFRWNFMDSYLDQKEYFSPYVFEDYAAEMLRQEPELVASLEKKRKENPEFAKSQWQQLFWLYKQSKFYEPNVGVLPIYLNY